MSVLRCRTRVIYHTLNLKFDTTLVRRKFLTLLNGSQSSGRVRLLPNRAGGLYYNNRLLYRRVSAGASPLTFKTVTPIQVEPFLLTEKLTSTYLPAHCEVTGRCFQVSV